MAQWLISLKDNEPNYKKQAEVKTTLLGVGWSSLTAIGVSIAGRNWQVVHRITQNDITWP